MVQIRDNEPNAMKTSECICTNLIIVSNTLLIGLNIKFCKIFSKKNICSSLAFQLTSLYLTKSRLSVSNTEILCEEHVKL